MKFLATSLLCLGSGASVLSAAVLNVTPGVNNVPIQQVTFTVNNTDVVQNSPAAGVTDVGDIEVYLKSLQVNDGGSIVTLGHFNVEGSEVRNVNPELVGISGTAGAGLRGLGVYDNGTITPSTAGIPAFASALAATTTDTDLRNFSYYDFLTSTPTQDVADYDLLFMRAMSFDDYVIVSERFGNTYFEITPLKEDGTPYEGANVLRFGGSSTGPAYSVYDWNSGYAAAGSNPTQAQAFSVASVSKFFEGTAVTPGPVYGFRIDNDGEADTKIFVVGTNPFSDNPYNPQLVPEPSAFLFATASLLGGLFRRRRD